MFSGISVFHDDGFVKSVFTYLISGNITLFDIRRLKQKVLNWDDLV